MNKSFLLFSRVLFSTHWITIINLILAVVLGYQVMHLLLMMNDPPLANLLTSHSRPLTSTSSLPTQTHLLNLTPLLEANFFGPPQATVLKPSHTALTPPPETPLNLTLQGIYYSTDPSASLAIITTPDGKTELYKQDKPLPNGITIQKIEPRKLILLRNGQQETLLLEGSHPDEGANPAEASSPGLATHTTTSKDADKAKPGQLLGDYQRQLQANPQHLMNLMHLSPVSQEGRFLGYRLSPGKDTQVLTQFNLQAGDILTAVNGVKLDSPLKGLTVVEQLATADHLELQILRNGQLVPLSFNIER